MSSMKVVIPELVEPIELNRVSQMVVRGKHYCDGDLLYIYDNIFSGNRRRLRSTHCEGALDIEMVGGNKTVILNNRLLDKDERETLAGYCGFENFEALLSCYENNGGLPLIGQLVRWL